MKSVLNVLIICIIALTVVNCGDSSSTGASNKYLGELPGVAEAYETQIEELEKKSKTATSMDEAFELEQKQKLAKEEAKEKIKEVTQKISFPIHVPYEGELSPAEYEVKSVEITNASFNSLGIKAVIVPKVTREHLFAYLHLVDKDGKPLASAKDWAVLAVSNFRNVKEGEEIEMRGSYNKGIENLENFEKIVFKTRDEYQANK